MQVVMFTQLPGIDVNIMHAKMYTILPLKYNSKVMTNIATALVFRQNFRNVVYADAAIGATGYTTHNAYILVDNCP